MIVESLEGTHGVRATKARGYAMDMEETELNAQCVAAPIWDGLGNVAGAISVPVLASRLSQSALADLTQSGEGNSVSKI
jgi:DNA-binding IclR family transcriptional regulator